MRAASSFPTRRRVRSSTACPMTSGARNSKKRRAPSKRPPSPPSSISTELPMADVGGIAGDRLKSFVERIERLEEERRALGQDIKEVFSEAKGNGFDPKIMRQVIRLRRMDKDDLDEQDALIDVYKRALGMLPAESEAAE